MNRKALFKTSLLFIVMLLLGTAFMVIAAQEDEELPCDAGQRDLIDVIAYGDEYFDAIDWRISESGENCGSTYAIWRNREQNDLYFRVDFLDFALRVTERELEDYFDQEFFDYNYQNYAPYESLASCELDGIHLYEFSSSAYEVKYMMPFWAMRDNEDSTRIIAISATVPVTHMALLNEYAERLFPELPSCEILGES